MTRAHPSAAAVAAPRAAASALVDAPARIVHATLALIAAAGIQVSLGAHYAWTVLPLAAVLLAASWRALAPRRAAALRADLVGAATALIGTALWTIVNIALAAEYMIVVRDPGFLTLSGLWLVDHPHTDIPAAGAVEAATADSAIIADASEAWNLKGDVIQPQGAKLLPATIAIGGWIAGDTGVLAANVVLGAVGILAVYAVARRFMGPLAALGPAGALALTVSHIGLSRAAYTEPLTLLMVMAGVLWVWRGLTERGTALVVVGAAVAGATSFVRIDGALYAIGALAGLVLALGLSEADARWRRRVGLAAIGAQAAVLGAGYAALAVWSTEYLTRLGERAAQLGVGYLALAVVGAVWAATWTSTGPVATCARRARDALGTRGAQAIGIAVSLSLVVLASRPLWMTTRRGTTDPGHVFANGVVESFQRAQGLPIDPTRTYGESTVTWLSYYLTWPLVFLGIAGFGIAAYRMVRRDSAWAMFLGALLGPSLMYLLAPSIIPDQIWAIRRFEPTALPGFVLAAGLAAWAAAALTRSAAARQVLRTVAAVAMIALPLTSWISLAPGATNPISTAINVTTREMIGARDQIADLCALSPGTPIVLVGTPSHFGSLRVGCEVPVVLALAPPTRSELALIAESWGEAPLVVTRSPDELEWETSPSVAVDSTVQHSAYTLEGIPRTYYEPRYRWYAGTPDANGVLVPLAEVATVGQG